MLKQWQNSCNNAVINHGLFQIVRCRAAFLRHIKVQTSLLCSSDTLKMGISYCIERFGVWVIVENIKFFSFLRLNVNIWLTVEYVNTVFEVNIFSWIFFKKSLEGNKKCLPLQSRLRNGRGAWGEMERRFLREQFIEVIKDKQHIERYAV